MLGIPPDLSKDGLPPDLGDWIIPMSLAIDEMAPPIDPQPDLESTVGVPHPGWLLQHPLSLAWDLGLGLASLRSQARCTDPVALLSRRTSQYEINCPLGLGSGLWSQVSSEPP